jgi:type I restriction enzyme S subunit
MATFETRTIEEVTETLIDYRGKTPPKAESGVRLVTAKVIKDGFIQEERAEYISEETYTSWMRRGYPQQRDIVLTTEAPLGEAAQLRATERIALAQRVILLRGNPNVIDQQFFFQAIKSPFVQAGLQQRATGTTVLGIKQVELRQVNIPYYPLPTQRKIAAILSAYDDLIENNLRRVKILEEMAQSLYREWFVKFRFPGHQRARFTDSPLGRITEGWEVKVMPAAVIIRPALPVPNNGQIPFVSMGSLSETSMFISEIEYRPKASGARFQNGDTLFARITPCLENGKTGFVQFLPTDDTVACGSTEFIVLRSKTVCPEYVYLMARSDPFRDNAIKSMSGATGRQRVREECFDKFLLAQPTAEVLKQFHSITHPKFQLIHSLSCKNQNLRRTRDLLLSRLISGEIDVSDLDIAVPEEAA